MDNVVYEIVAEYKVLNYANAEIMNKLHLCGDIKGRKGGYLAPFARNALQAIPGKMRSNVGLSCFLLMGLIDSSQGIL